MFRSANNSFDTLLQKATVPTQLELDWDATLNLCDLIRSGQVKAAYAIEQIQELLSEENPRTVLFALAVVDAVVKNCGKSVHDEVITRAFLNEMHNLATRSTNTDVRQKALEMLQCWAHGFQSKPEYDAVKDLVNLMKLQGCQFPAMTEADAMFDAACAPEWMDGNKCHRCRTEFSILNRKHHCRNCGQIFCHKCSSKQVPLLKYGIEKPVRVCDSCIDALKHGSIKKQDSEGSDSGVQLGQQQRVSRSHSESNSSKRGTASSGQLSTSLQPSLPPELMEYFNSPLAKENQAPQPKTKEDELREREEVELALALSQSEIEAQKQKQKQSSVKNPLPQSSMGALRGNSANKSRRQQEQQADEYTSSNDSFGTLKPVKSILKNADANSFSNKLGQDGMVNGGGSDNYTSELDKYLNRSLWENKQGQQMMAMIEPSAPSPSVTTDNSSISSRSTFVREPPTSAASMQHHNSSSYARDFNSNSKLPNSGVVVQEQRQQNGEPDAVGDSANGRSGGNASSLSTLGASRAEIEKFIAAMDTNIDVFTARIQSDVARNRSIHSDPTVQTLFQTITARHPDLVAYISQMDENRTQLEGLQDKITRLREAREALEALRADHQDKLRRNAEEQARLRQQQMFEKLDVLRYKKRELLDEQRRLALQRIHDQEVQLQMKLDSRRYGVPQQPMPTGSNMMPYDAANMPIDSSQHHHQQPYGNVMPSMMPPYSQPYYNTAYYNGVAAASQQPLLGNEISPTSQAPTNIPAAIQQQLQQQPHPHWTMFPTTQQQQPAQYSSVQPSFHAAVPQSSGSASYVQHNGSQSGLNNQHQQHSGYAPQQMAASSMPPAGYHQHDEAARAAVYPQQSANGVDPTVYQQQQQQPNSNGQYQQQQQGFDAGGVAPVQFNKMDGNANAQPSRVAQQHQQPPAPTPAKADEALLISFD